MFGRKQARILRLVDIIQHERARNDELRAALRRAEYTIRQAQARLTPDSAPNK